MSTKTRYINPSQAARVAEVLQRQGYPEASASTGAGYAINVAQYFDLHDEERVRQIIDITLDGYYTDAEDYAVED